MKNKITTAEKPLVSLLIKPAGPDCDMSCAYCFYKHKVGLFPGASKHRMSDGTLQTLIEQALSQSGEHISFGWQGGEPTLMGLEFFKRAVALQQSCQRGQSIQNSLQTNGLLIDASWAEFLKTNNFLVGLSIDGPEHIHDRHRKTIDGKGTWKKTADRAKLLLDRGVPVNALSVITERSAQFPEEIYQFHKDLGLNHMQFIPCVERDIGNPEQIAPFSVTPEGLGAFWTRAFDLWIADIKDGVASTSIRFFDSIFYYYVGLKPPDCALMPECGTYLTVEHNGDVFPCDFFVEPEWKLGNITANKLIHMLNSHRQTQFGKAKAQLSTECEQCEWLHHCRGGCVKERGFNSNDKQTNHLCAAYKIFFEHAHPEFLKLAETWRSEKRRSTADRIASGISPPGRNEPCPCGSGLKFKKCCGH